MFTLEPAETCCAFFPHWQGDVKLRRRFLTAITTVEGGTEQRSGIRQTPAHVLSYNITTNGQAQTSYLKRRFKQYINKVWSVPVWPYNMELTAAAPAGTDTLNVNSTYHRELDQFSLSGEYSEVILVKDYKTVESGEVVSYTENTITIDKVLDTTWGAGSRVYPLMKGTLGTTINLEAVTPDFAEIMVEFTESDRSVYEE